MVHDSARRRKPFVAPGERITVPCGIALVIEPVERTYNVQRWAELSRRGHFPTLELREFFRGLR
jgi:hypothetical protein